MGKKKDADDGKETLLDGAGCVLAEAEGLVPPPDNAPLGGEPEHDRVTTGADEGKASSFEVNTQLSMATTVDDEIAKEEKDPSHVNMPLQDPSSSYESTIPSEGFPQKEILQDPDSKAGEQEDTAGQASETYETV